MQMKGATGELFKYNSTWHAFNVIAKTEGIKGLFKGMWPNLLKASINNKLWRRGGVVVSVLATRLSSLGSSPDQGHYVVFLGKTLAVPFSTQV